MFSMSCGPRRLPFVYFLYVFASFSPPILCHRVLTTPYRSHFPVVRSSFSFLRPWSYVVFRSLFSYNHDSTLPFLLLFHSLFRPPLRLIDSARRPNRRENQLAMDALKDLFITDLLPDRKLRPFHAQPLLAEPEKNPQVHTQI